MSIPSFVKISQAVIKCALKQNDRKRIHVYTENDDVTNLLDFIRNEI